MVDGYSYKYFPDRSDTCCQGRTELCSELLQGLATCLAVSVSAESDAILLLQAHLLVHHSS